ncbi:MAG: hypothetical protein BWK80_15460 [Desulfobacteraceae bacterium IS3]|nr:MAG: hypothetical protein BWK80_15460 [Desulfobacteraceae bacterium IS3]
MFQTIIASLLEEKTGLTLEAAGVENLSKAFRRRIAACGLSSEDEVSGSGMAVYLSYLQHSKEEWEHLIEAAVVPETWFFRNKASFSFLGGYVRFEWLPARAGSPAGDDSRLRILCIPCSTGEEPYSVAMTLTDMGLSDEIRKGRFCIDAIDISAKALRKAKAGVFGRESFRGDDLTFRDRYFDRVSGTGDTFILHSRIKNMVRFQAGNLADENLLADEKPYHIIFCRNLLIYLSDTAKQRAIAVITRLLAQNGILFVGHVERPLISGCAKKIHFVWIRQAGVFACRRAGGDEHADAGIPGISPRKKFSAAKSPVSVRTAQDRQMHGRLTLSRDMSIRKTAPEPGSVTDSRAANQTAEHIRTAEIIAQAHPTPLSDTARKLADQGNLAESLELCEKYLAEEPFHVQVHFLTGLLYNALNDESRAEQYFNRTVYLDPNHHEALSHLALIMERRGERERAGHFRSRAMRILDKTGSTDTKGGLNKDL